MTDDVPDRVAAGLVGSWRRQASLVPEGVVYEVDGLVVALTNLPDDTLNVALVGQEPSEPADALGAVDRLFARHGQRLGVDLDQGRHPEVERAAAAMGLSVIESRMGMARSLEGFSPGPWPEDVRIRPMRDDSEVDGYADLAWLQASHEAEGVYARLGFEPVSPWQVWARPAPTWRLPAHSTYTAPHDGRDIPGGGHGAHAPVRGE